MAKHTGTTWEFVAGLNDYGHQSPEAPILGTITTGGEYPLQIAVVVSDVVDATGNAAVLAAAPDMLATLKMLRAADDAGVREGYSGTMGVEQRSVVDAAIAKAEGRS